MKQKHAAIQAKKEYAHGIITREEAEKRIAPYIDEVNRIGKLKAKEFGVSFRAVSVIGYLR